jgi:hypothetical protein
VSGLLHRLQAIIDPDPGISQALIIAAYQRAHPNDDHDEGEQALVIAGALQAMIELRCIKAGKCTHCDEWHFEWCLDFRRAQ